MSAPSNDINRARPRPLQAGPRPLKTMAVLAVTAVAVTSFQFYTDQPQTALVSVPSLVTAHTGAAGVVTPFQLDGTSLPSEASALVSPAAASGSRNTAAKRILGNSRSGLPWHSGAWVGGRFTPKHIAGFGSWRGRSADIVTTYSPQSSYKAMTNETWSITTWKGFPGRLNYGLAMLPDNGAGSLKSIGAGKQDKVWRQVAKNLRVNGRGNSVVRVGWELNLADWRWNVTTKNAAQYKKAYRRIVTTMRKEAPGLKFEFGIACGAGLRGSKDRLAPLTKVYPGSDVVDLVGCDTYDWWNTHATNSRNWSKVLTPSAGPGIQDVVNFARKHRKGASFAEWGLARKSNGGGGGDNPFYISAMHSFFSKNRDVVAFECYFDEPDSYIRNSLYGTNQNPNSRRVYAKLW